MIVLLVIERATAATRGDLTRWVLEVSPGVYAGRVTPRVRDRLWKRATRTVRNGACVMLYDDPGREQGVGVRTHGDRTRELVTEEGLTLVRLPLRPTDRPPRDASGGRAQP